MGHGDDIMATGMAKGARARGKRIAFGDGDRIIWGPFSKEIFRGNPNIAAPGQEREPDIEWMAFYKGNRIYNRHDKQNNRWIWNYDFRVKPGEIYFQRPPIKNRRDIIVLEPNVPGSKTKGYTVNKQWPIDHYQGLADWFAAKRFRVIQPWYPNARVRLNNVQLIETPTYTDALALIKTAELLIGPEGGLHHGAAAVGTRAVVFFGHFIPPQVTGYDTHVNLTGGAQDWCGSFARCQCCVDTMSRISVDEVISAVQGVLNVSTENAAG